MRYAIFADIHGNLEALNAVLSVLSKEKIDSYLCGGDIIGYGADPLACIDRLREFNCFSVPGNHEWAAVGLFPTDYFNPYAKKAVLWTSKVLRENDVSFIKGLKMVFENEDLVMVHTSLNNPEEFSYIFESYDSKETFELLNRNVCFIAHTHTPRIFVKRDVIISNIFDNKIEINPDYKYIVNVGSIGQPRDGDPRSSYCIYDTDSKILEVQRIGYDIKSAQKKIINAGLPPVLAKRLSEGR